jgi:Sulfotransferase domain
LPVFQFNKALSVVQDVKVFLKRKKIKSKKQEFSRIKNEIRSAKEPAETIEHRKRRKKRAQQEIFQLERELRAAKKRAKGAPAGRPAPQVTGQSETGALPDFVIIGAKKCGTTSLYHLLTQHPHVEPAASKGLHYFDLLFDEGNEWYRRCFSPPRWKDGRRSITGEATSEYLFHPPVPERMAEVVPQARLIALLRNPVDRAYSDYQQRVRKGGEPRTFEEAIEAEKTWSLGEEGKASEHEVHASLYDARHWYLSKGTYADQLPRWSKFFGDEQMLVLKSEDFFERTPETLKLVLDFLDLPDWEPDSWEIRGQGTYKQKMDPATRQRLEEYFEPHNQRLYEYLGVNFGW